MSWQRQLAPRAGNIELPHFELKSKYRLNEPLQSLGMIRAFRSGSPDEAQLTGMFASAPDQTGARNFFISSVLQSTYWKVDEEGSEAAAVTTIGMRTALAQRMRAPFQMIVDRPFFCAIEDRRTRRRSLLAPSTIQLLEDSMDIDALHVAIGETS
jgi:serine protease inhibitor